MFATLELIVKRRRELDAAEAAWLKEVAAYDHSGDWRVDKFFSAGSTLRHACRMSHGVAHGHVTLARKLEYLPVVAEAFDEGAISARHAAVIVDAYTDKRAAAINAAEETLTECARTHNPRELRSVVKYLTDALDGDGGAGTDQTLFERREHHQSRTLDGMLAYSGICDPEMGNLLEAALKAELHTDHVKADPRTPGQRRSDALMNLVQRGHDHRTQDPNSHNVRHNVTVVVDTDDLPGATPDLIARMRSERRMQGYVSSVTLERMLCDCSFTRVITHGRSEVLDVGRATRNVTVAQWKALVVRDRHCTAPGCDRPPSACEAHHIGHWEDGGPTDLDNLRLLCWGHHRQQHIDDARARAPDRYSRCTRGGADVDVEAFLDEHVRFFNVAVDTRDWSDFVARFSDDAVLEFVGPPIGPFSGRSAIAKAYAAEPSRRQDRPEW